jgi:glycosyl hydrolase family 95
MDFEPKRKLMITRSRLLTVAAAGAVAVALAVPSAAARQDSAAPQATTAWADGSFHENVPGVVGRSDVVLGQPNSAASQAMPLGNGTLGVAAWAADGFTAQLNRADTMPDRLSPGQVVIPGLSQLTGAADFHGRLDLYNGTLTESGGGMTATAYVRSGTDEMVVDVTGANPDVTQTAELKLWQPRTPQASASGAVGTLAQTWTDTGRPGSTGQTFGSLAAVTAGGRDVHASVTGALTVQVSFRPNADGSFRVVVAAPHWAGGDAMATAHRLLAGTTEVPAGVLQAGTGAWWHRYWQQAGLMRLTSSDGSAQYFENLRMINLYADAAERGTTWPGSQAGVADLFDSDQDTHSWDPADFWGWNLRMLVTSNLGAGEYANNDGYFALYRNALPTIENWTSSQFGGLPGGCVPETMRFNGAGYQTHNDGSGYGARPYLDCSGTSVPNYNARTLTTGAEVSLFIWEQYLQTDSQAFLRQNYPVMRAWAQFMLSYAKVGADGKLHTSPSNAHETQWDVTDPVTDISAMRAVFPDIAQAARALHTDSGLAAQLDAAVKKVMPLPRTDEATRTQQLTPAADEAGTDVIGMSYDQGAPTHNVENLGLEPVWPYGLIGDQGPLSALAKRTFTNRPYVERNDWSFDPIDAAVLGMPSAMVQTMTELTEQFQNRPSGLASFGSSYQEPYIEQSGVVATTLDYALAQDTGGVLQIAPAWPSDWDGSGTVYIEHQDKVDVQVSGGTVVTAAVQAGSDAPVTVRNPWPGQQVQVVTGDARHTAVVAPTTASQFTIPARAGGSYLIERTADPVTALPYQPVTGTQATTYKTLGPAAIGLPPATS